MITSQEERKARFWCIVTFFYLSCNTKYLLHHSYLLTTTLHLSHLTFSSIRFYSLAARRVSLYFLLISEFEPFSQSFFRGGVSFSFTFIYFLERGIDVFARFHSPDTFTFCVVPSSSFYYATNIQWSPVALPSQPELSLSRFSQSMVLIFPTFSNFIFSCLSFS